MAYRYPFQFLSRVEVRYLSSLTNEDFRKAYIDCLGLLQAILARYSSTSFGSIFDDASLAIQLIEKTLRNMPTLNYVPEPGGDPTQDTLIEEKVSIVQTGMIEKLDSNRKIAISLRSEYERTTGTTQQYILRLIEDYLDQLLRQYRELRHPNIEALTVG